MAEKTWIPSDYMDEVIPTPRKSPSDWIVQLPGDGVFALAPCEEEDEPTHLLKNGDLVKFDWMEDHGRAEFTVRDGKWSVDRQPPPETTHICEIGNPDSLSYEGIEVFAKNWLSVDHDDTETTLFYYTWSEQSEVYEFRDGKFIPAPPAGTVEG